MSVFISEALDSLKGLDENPVQKEEPLEESVKPSTELNETQDVSDQIIIKTNEDGFITKMDDLRAKGYKVSWSGNGQICMVKPKEIQNESADTFNKRFLDLPEDKQEIVKELQKNSHFVNWDEEDTSFYENKYKDKIDEFNIKRYGFTW